MSTRLIPIFSGANVVSTGGWIAVQDAPTGAQFCAFLSGGITPTSTVALDTSLDMINIVPAGIASLSVTGTSVGAVASIVPLLYVRANITAASGGGLMVVQMGTK